MPAKNSSSNSVSNRDLYSALDGIGTKIDNTRLEVKGDIRDLRQQFDNLEAGRLTRAEGNINDLRVELQKAINTFTSNTDGIKQSQASWSGKLVVLGLIGSLCLAALLNFIAFKISGARP